MQLSGRIHNPFAHYGLLILIYAVGFVTLFGHTILHATTEHEHAANHSHPAVSDNCQETGKTHEIAFTDSSVSPVAMTVERCAVIRIKNLSTEKIIPALGSHDHHAEYPGFDEQRLLPGGTYSFRALTTGTYAIHDHNRDSAKAMITIKN